MHILQRLKQKWVLSHDYFQYTNEAKRIELFHANLSKIKEFTRLLWIFEFFGVKSNDHENMKLRFYLKIC